MKLILIIYMLLSAGCMDIGSWRYHPDGNYGPAWWDDKANVQGPSESAPESLKPYYDPELTKALNR